MKTNKRRNWQQTVFPTRGRSAGFSLIELMIATAMFLIVAGAAFSLLASHQPLFNQQQNKAALNINVRNAIAQMQLDLVNAGTGYYVGANIPGWPVGVTIQNSNPGTSCFNSTTHVYSSTCFDHINVIAMDANTPPVHPTDSTGTTCVSTTSSTIFTDPAPGMTLAQTAAVFHDGDQLLLVKSDGSQMTTTILSSDGDTSGGKVRLQHNPTAADGTNTSTDDPLGISTNLNNKLGTNFCGSDWVLKISPILYSVDASDSSNPKLMRSQGGSSSVLAEQVIGFKVGATLWNAGTSTDTLAYNYDSSSYGYEYSRVRSVQISLIARTVPVTDPTYKFRNLFDQGPYEIEGVSAVVNPRNMSMKD